ncbi:tetratricopeptide repeat protein [Desulfonatronum thiosulfatophilum]|uniref:tetratricopeptide repeat protein n=1 Tax=Desulfonatronum thiosulfatophilum TaxID=617002 RepID=UPI001FC9131E|nr:tetratricopeptide repeat protein [Desulfonatronum thiosulfatophilum]
MSCTAPRIVLLSDPLDAQEYNDLGVSYEASGETALALEAYASAAKKDRGWDQPLINQGNVHAALEDWRSAEASYRQALRRNPENPEGMNNLAYVLLKQGAVAEANRWSSRALTAEPDNPLFKSTRAMVFAAAGDAGQARKYLESAMQNLPPDDPLHHELLLLQHRLLPPQ